MPSIVSGTDASNMNINQPLLRRKPQSSEGVAEGIGANDETNRNKINVTP